MPQRPLHRLLFAVIVVVLIGIIGRNLYCRSLNQRLLEAYQRRDVAQMRSLLRRGANPNAPSPNGQSVAQIAFNHFTHRGNVDADQREDNTIRLLVESGAKINGIYDDKGSLFTQSCHASSPEIVRLLLARHIPVPSDALDTTFSQWSFQRPFFANAPPIGLRQPNFILTPVNKQLQADSDEVLRLLLANGQKLRLWQATRMGDLNAMRAALERGADVNAGNSQQDSALLIAAQTGNMEAAQLLLAHGARVEENKGRDSPLLGALTYHHADVARLLLDQGASVSKATQYSNRVLSTAIGNTPELVPELLRRGADFHAWDVLPAALRAHNTALIRDLLRRGAVVNPMITPQKPTLDRPIASISMGSRPRAATPLATTTPLAVAVANAPEYVELLLKAGADVSNANKTILILAARSNHVNVAPMLIQAGADVNAKDEMGETVLTTALQHAPALVPLLLAQGADPNLANQLKRPPLTIAAMQGDATNARLLLAHNANPNILTSGGRTALFFAQQHKQAEIITLLEKAGAR